MVRNAPADSLVREDAMHSIDAEMAAIIDRLRRLRAEVQQALRAVAPEDRGGVPDDQRQRGRQADNTTPT